MSARAIRVLPRHPAAHSNESLWGYILRVSAANGFRSPWSVFNRAGMEQYETRSRSLKIEKLASVTCQKITDLNKIVYYNPNSPQEYILLGHDVPPGELELELPRVCIQCVQKLGYVEAHWDLGKMNGCPIHMRQAVSFCPACRVPLRWYRQGLLRCGCGSRLDSVDVKPIGKVEAELLQVVRAKVLRQLPLTTGQLGLPITELYRLKLSTLLKVIRVIARCSELSGVQPARDGGHDSVCCAANVLSNWPHGFFTLLNSMRNGMATGTSDIRKEYAPLYSALLKRNGASDTGELNFMREAFLDFVSNQPGPRPTDDRLMRSFDFKISRRFVARAELSRIANVNPRTIKNMLQRLPVMEEGNVNSSASRTVIDSHRLPFTIRRPGVILNLRGAAAQLGMPAQTLRSLRASGHFEVVSLPNNKVGFHEDDVERFNSKIIALAQSSGSGGNRSILLRDAMTMKRSSFETKANLIRAILGKKVPLFVRGEKGSRLPELENRDVMKFLNEERFGHGAICLTGIEAAARLQCDFDVMVKLVAMGLLSGKKERSNWRILFESVERFVNEYWPISSLATDLKTSSRRIQDACSKSGIELLVVSPYSGRSKLYARAADKRRISWLLGGSDSTDPL